MDNLTVMVLHVAGKGREKQGDAFSKYAMDHEKFVSISIYFREISGLVVRDAACLNTPEECQELQKLGFSKAKLLCFT